MGKILKLDKSQWLKGYRDVDIELIKEESDLKQTLEVKQPIVLVSDTILKAKVRP